MNVCSVLITALAVQIWPICTGRFFGLSAIGATVTAKG
jgi:hypothetical protein